MDFIMYQILKTILNTFKKNTEDIDEPSVQRYVNKIENRITFKIKNGYTQTPETMKHQRQ